MMEIKARGRRPGSKNYTREFRTQVVAEALNPGRSIAEVAQSHGLNANLVSKWRRDLERGEIAAQLPAPETFLPVQVEVATPASTQSSVIVVERGAVRVRFEGTPDLNVLHAVLASLRTEP